MTVIAHFDLLLAFFFGLIWLGIVLHLRIKRRKSFEYLALLTIFYAYLYKVLDYTLFQFQSLLFLKHFAPNLMLKGSTAGESLNLIPLLTLTSADLKTSLLNILLFVPFGLGLPFVTRLRMKWVLIVGALVSVGIEVLQFLTGYLAGMTFRVADINDVLFNTVGVLIGYFLFLGITLILRK